MRKTILIIGIFLISLTTNAQFGSPVVIDSTISATIINIITADLNNDGKKDIITSHYQNQINWYKNNIGNFSSKQSITNTLPKPYHLDVADANGDGFIDVLATNDQGNNSSVVLYFNVSGGTSWNQIIIDDSIQGAAYKSFFVDVENDGDLDIITNTDMEITMYKNLGLGNFSSRIIISDTINSNEFYSLTVNDFNNDNFKDFAVHSGHGLQLYINNTDTTFTLTDTIDTSLNGFITSIDIDNDNDIDILSVISSAQNITTFKNDGLGNFTFFEATSYYCGNLQNLPFVNTRLNNDLFTDALYIPIVSRQIFWKQNNGIGNLTTPIMIDSTFLYLNVYTDDIDNDSDNDIIWYGNNTNTGVKNLGVITNNTIVLSLNDLRNDNHITIYPNPANEFLNIETKGNIKEIYLYNNIGQLLLTTFEKKINLQNLQNGLYFIRILLKDGTIYTEKIIKTTNR